MRITAKDLMGTASVAVKEADRLITEARGEQCSAPGIRLDVAEAKLIQALAEVRAAAWSLDTGKPFDDGDLDRIIDREECALADAHAEIPA